MLGGEQPAENPGAQPKKAVKVDVLNMVDRLVERAEHSYDPEKVPPVKEWVERHMKAKRVGKVVKKIDQMNEKELEQLKNQVCPCCLLDPNITEYRLCDDPESLGELGSGYVAFFKLMKLCIGLCFLLALANIYKVVANVKGNFCFNVNDPIYDLVKLIPIVCGRDWITVHSLANYGGSKVDYADKGIMLGYFALFLVILVFFYPHLKHLGEMIDKKSDLPSDWTVQLKDVTPGTTEGEIVNYFNNVADLPGLIGSRVEKITSSYKLEEYEAKKAEVEALKLRLKVMRVEEAKALRKRLTKMETKLLSQITLPSPSPQKKGDKAREADHTPKEIDKNNEKKALLEKNHQQTDDGDKTPGGVTHAQAGIPIKQTTLQPTESSMFSKEFHDLVIELQSSIQQLKELKHKIKNNRDEYFNNIYYLTFSTKRIHDEVLKIHHSSDSVWSRMFSRISKSRISQGTQRPITFRMKQAPEPGDILWHNLSATNWQKFKARFVTWFLTFVLIGIGFGIVLGLKVLQRNMSKNLKASDSQFDKSTIEFRALSVAISFVVLCINTILPMLMRRLTQMEKQITNSDFFRSLTFKIAFAQFINTNIVIVITHAIIMYPEIPVWGKGAILNDAWFILLSQVIVNPLLNTCSPWYFLHCMKKRSVAKSLENDTCTITQAEAHTKVEMPIWDPAFSYAGMINNFYTVVFFQPLLPLSATFGFLAFSFMYWSHKHRLLRMSVRPMTLSDNIAHTTLYFISMAAMIYGISSMIFDKFTYDYLTLPSIIIFAIGGSAIFFPWYRIFGNCAANLDCYLTHKDKVEQNIDGQYEHFRTCFVTEYDRANPLTSEEAMEEYMNFLYSANTIQSKDKQKYANLCILNNMMAQAERRDFGTEANFQEMTPILPPMFGEQDGIRPDSIAGLFGALGGNNSGQNSNNELEFLLGGLTGNFQNSSGGGSAMQAIMGLPLDFNTFEQGGQGGFSPQGPMGGMGIMLPPDMVSPQQDQDPYMPPLVPTDININPQFTSEGAHPPYGMNFGSNDPYGNGKPLLLAPHGNIVMQGHQGLPPQYHTTFAQPQFPFDQQNNFGQQNTFGHQNTNLQPFGFGHQNTNPQNNGMQPFGFGYNNDYQ